MRLGSLIDDANALIPRLCCSSPATSGHHLALLAKIARMSHEPDVLHGLRTLPAARASVDLIRLTEQALCSVPVASS